MFNNLFKRVNWKIDSPLIKGLNALEKRINDFSDNVNENLNKNNLEVFKKDEFSPTVKSINDSILEVKDSVKVIDPSKVIFPDGQSLLDKNDKNIKLKKLCKYYGYPIGINGAWEVEKAANQYAKYDLWIVGDNYNNPSHETHIPTRNVISKLLEIKPNIELFGYVPCAGGRDPDDEYQDPCLTIEEIKQRIDWWVDMGLKGIFLDEWGYDYYNTRERQNQIMEYVVSLNLIPFFNSWKDEYTFSSEDITISWMPGFRPNPNRLEPIIPSKSYIQYENFFWRARRPTGQEHGSCWNVYRAYDYFNKVHSEYGQTYYKRFKSEPVVLDSIHTEIENSFEAKNMRTISIYMSLMLNVKYIGFGNEYWSSKGNFLHWDLPEILVNKPTGLTDVKVKDTSALVWEWTANIDGVNLKAFWGNKDSTDINVGRREVYVNDQIIYNAWEKIIKSDYTKNIKDNSFIEVWYGNKDEFTALTEKKDNIVYLVKEYIENEPVVTPPVDPPVEPEPEVPVNIFPSLYSEHSSGMANVIVSGDTILINPEAEPTNRKVIFFCDGATKIKPNTKYRFVLTAVGNTAINSFEFHSGFSAYEWIGSSGVIGGANMDIERTSGATVSPTSWNFGFEIKSGIQNQELRFKFEVYEVK